MTLPDDVVALFRAETREFLLAAGRMNSGAPSDWLATHLHNLAGNAEAMGFTASGKEARRVLGRVQNGLRHEARQADLAALELTIRKDLRGTLAEKREEPQRSSAFLHPGELKVSKRPLVITTILGSCVSVCLWDTITGAGGMNHFLLAARGSDGVPSLRNGEDAMSALLEQVLRCGGSKERLRAKLYGGASMLMPQNPTAMRIGSRNVEIALQYLRLHRIPVVESDTGDTTGMKITFTLPSGTTTVQRM